MRTNPNQRCPCGKGVRYKNCCMKKDQLKEEVNGVVKELLDQFELRGMKFRKTFMEEDMRGNIESLYLQCKYISEEIGVSALRGKDFNENKHEIVHRKAKLIQKLLWNMNQRDKGNNKAYFEIGGHRQEIEPIEYIEIILSTFSSVFEHYMTLLRKNEVFKGTQLADGLNLQEIKNSIDSPKSIEKLFNTLAEKSKEKYPSFNITPLFQKIAYNLRCASFHNDYAFRKHRDFFSIVLKDGENINIYELLKLSNDIFAKMNILGLIPHYFTKGLN